VCQTLFEREGRVGQRKLWGIVGLVRHYPNRLVDNACARAMAEGVYSYGRVKALTEQLMDEALKLLSEPADAPVALTQNHDLIRQGDDYADLFSLAAKQSAALPAPQTPTQSPYPTQNEAA